MAFAWDFEILAPGALETLGDGTRVYYPRSAFGPGLIVESNEQEAQIREARLSFSYLTFGWAMSGLATFFAGIVFNSVFQLGLFVYIVMLYALVRAIYTYEASAWMSPAVQGLAATRKRPPFMRRLEIKSRSVPKTLNGLFFLFGAWHLALGLYGIGATTHAAGGIVLAAFGAAIIFVCASLYILRRRDEARR